MSDNVVLIDGEGQEDRDGCGGGDGVRSGFGSGSGGDAPGIRRAREAGPGVRLQNGRLKAAHRHHPAYSLEFRLRVVKRHLEEGLSTDQVCIETGVSPDAMAIWLKRFKAGGESALKPHSTSRRGRSQIAAAVKAEMVGQKRQNPASGVKRISQ